MQTENLTLSEAVETLVTRVIDETQKKRELYPKRRPTWAPPLPFPFELINALERLKTLHPRLSSRESRYGRLWAVWASPKYCQGELIGFDLRAGKEHNGEVLLAARRGREGIWCVGPNWWVAPQPPKEVEPFRLPKWFETSEKKGLTSKLHVTKEELEQSHLAREQARFAKEQQAFIRRQKSYELRVELRELALPIFLEFMGAPDAVMQAGARIAGICCCCGRTLTDPTSLKFGIGPECRGFANG